MSRKSDRDTNARDRLYAALGTLAAAGLLLLLLFFTSVGDDRALLAESVTPEIMAEEDLFLEPELIDLGEEEAKARDEAAPAVQGEPEKADAVEPQTVVKGENNNPAPAREKSASQKKDSPVKTAEPQKTEREEKKAANPAAGKFSGKSGGSDAKPDGNASGGEGTGITGSARGRRFISCDAPETSLRFKTVITVDVVVDAEGKVTSATARSGGGAAIRRECERAARTARWSAKKGAGETRGTITFTITPR